MLGIGVVKVDPLNRRRRCRLCGFEREGNPLDFDWVAGQKWVGKFEQQDKWKLSLF